MGTTKPEESTIEEHRCHKSVPAHLVTNTKFSPPVPTNQAQATWSHQSGSPYHMLTKNRFSPRPHTHQVQNTKSDPLGPDHLIKHIWSGQLCQTHPLVQPTSTPQSRPDCLVTPIRSSPLVPTHQVHPWRSLTTGPAHLVTNARQVQPPFLHNHQV